VTDVAPHTEYYDNLLSHSSFCNLIQRHFSGVFIQDDELSTYIRALEKCNTDLLENDSALVFLLRSSDFNFSIRHPFTKMESNFYNIFYKSITGTNNGTLDLVASATLSNARATIQGTLLSVYYAEKYRWTHAVQDCSSQLIPHSLITSQGFTEKLDEISKRERFLKNYDYAIPMSLISKYYSVPIADCTYTNDTFVVRIQLPVKAKASKIDTTEAPPPSPRLLTLKPATFVYHNKICSVQVDSQQRYAYDGINNIAYRTNCKSNELCLNSETFAHRFVDRCATALVGRNFEEVITYCKFECAPQIRTSIFGEEPGEVMRAGNDKFIIAGHGTKAVVNCHSGGSSSAPYLGNDQSSISVNSKEESTEFSVEGDGALEVTLPCKCNMEVNRQRYYASAFNGCEAEGELVLSRVIPWHLVKEHERDGDDLSPDESLLKFYTTQLAGRENEGNAAGLPGSAAASTNLVQAEGSLVPLWLFFGFTSSILFLVQCYIIYLLRQSNSAGGNYSRHQLLFKARDPEPQVGLLETPYENM